MLIAQGYFAGLERCIISDTKTKVFIVNCPVDTDTWNLAGIFSINGKLIEVVEECTHLGIKRDSDSNSGHSTTVEDRIKSAPGCAYSLMGAGLHGENGGNPRVSLSFWTTYVLPLLTYGFDVLTLSNSEIQKLNQFHQKKSSSRSCISTSEQLTRQYIYCLVSCLWWQIYISVSWVRWKVLRSNSIERELAERQILLKDKKIEKLVCLCRSNPISVQFAKYH